MDVGAANIIWVIFQIIVGFNLVFPLILQLIYSFRSTQKQGASQSENVDYAVIITAYQFIDTLPEVIDSAQKLNYQNYHIYVVADNCDISSLHLSDPRVTVLKPEQVLRGNTRSHFYAIDRFVRKHDFLTIIDSDNIIDPDYLININKVCSLGFEAVQGVRKAKNLDSIYARLDAARDIYYHYYDCKLLFHSGSSATLSGSGMAFKVELYEDCLRDTNVEGAGFDKVLQAKILERNRRIAFCESAIVYDQKTSHSQQLVNQRSRWINTWFKYFWLGFKLIAKSVKNLSLNQFLFGTVLLRPPLFLFLIASILLMLINLFINPMISCLWLGGLLIFVSTFFVALIKSNSDARIYGSLLGIPKFVFYQIISLTKARKANIRSVSTRHNQA